jgi:glycerol-3-phosphate acyltransferase PlsY
MMVFDPFITVPVIIAYLIGSIPTSVWVGRIFYNVDVRKEGSGNAGATNTIRVLGTKAGIPVLIFDVFKGWLAVFILCLFHFENLSEGQLVYLEMFMGIAAVVGHIFPIYVGFKGGKGVATIAGVGMALYPVGFFYIAIIFIVCLLISRIVSISSITTAISFPLIVIFILHNPHLPLIILAIAISIFIPITHRKNIVRLLKGEEKKFSFKKKRK